MSIVLASAPGTLARHEESYEPAHQGSEPAAQGSEPPTEGSELPAQGSEPPTQGSEPPAHGSVPPSQDSERPTHGYKSLTVYQELATVPLVNLAVEKYCDLKNKLWLLKPGLNLMEYTYGGILNIVSNFGVAKSVDKMVGSKMEKCKEKFPTLFQSPAEVKQVAKRTVKRRVRKLMDHRVGRRVITSLDWVTDRLDDMIERAGGHPHRRVEYPASPRRPVTRSITRRAALKAAARALRMQQRSLEEREGDDSETVNGARSADLVQARPRHRTDLRKRNRGQQTIISSFRRSEMETQTGARGLWCLAPTMLLYSLERVGSITAAIRRYIGGRRRRRRVHVHPDQQRRIDARRKLSPRKLHKPRTAIGRARAFVRTAITYLPFHGLIMPASMKLMPTAPSNSPQGSPRRTTRPSQSPTSQQTEEQAGIEAQQTAADPSRPLADATSQAVETETIVEPAQVEEFGNQPGPDDPVATDRGLAADIEVAPDALLDPAAVPGHPETPQTVSEKLKKRKHTDGGGEVVSEEDSDASLADLDENYDSYVSEEDPDYVPEEPDSDLSEDDSDDAEPESDLEDLERSELDTSGVRIVEVHALTAEEMARYRQDTQIPETDGDNGEQAEDGGHDSPEKTPEKFAMTRSDRTTPHHQPIEPELQQEETMEVHAEHAEQVIGDVQQLIASHNLDEFGDDMFRDIPKPEKRTDDTERDSMLGVHQEVMEHSDIIETTGHVLYEGDEERSPPNNGECQERPTEVHGEGTDESVDTCEEVTAELVNMADPAVSDIQETPIS